MSAEQMVEPTAPRHAGAENGSANGVRPASEAMSATIRLPFFSARVELPRHHEAPARGAAAAVRGGGAGRGEGAGHQGWQFGPVSVPSPRKSAYYLGIGVLAGLQVLEWPVAVALAAGTWVAQHTRPDEPAIAAGHRDSARHGPTDDAAAQRRGASAARNGVGRHAATGGRRGSGDHNGDGQHSGERGAQGGGAGDGQHLGLGEQLGRHFGLHGVRLRSSGA
jgi:hypothetical protein